MNKNNREIDAIVIKSESFDSDNLREEISEYTTNFLMFFWNYKRIWLEYKPQWVDVKKKEIINYSFGNPKLDSILIPLLHSAIHFKRFFWFLSICFKYKVKVIITDLSVVALFFGLLKKIGLVKKVIYWCGDWYGGSKYKFGIWSNVGNNGILPFIDFLACKVSDITLDISSKITKARRNYWGKEISKRHFVYRCPLKLRKKYFRSNIKKTGIFFLGTVRADSGLQIILQTFNSSKYKNNFFLKIAGSPFHFHEVLDSEIKKYKAGNFVNYVGFAEREKLIDIVSDCFCGVNLLTDKESFSNLTFPAKVMDYLQYLLPVIVTKNVGQIYREIEKYELGLVINPTREQFIKAIKKIFENQEKYQKNILNYLRSQKGLKIGEVIMDKKLHI